MHNRFHRPLRGWGVTHWVAKTCMASSGPVVAWYVYSSIAGWMAAGAGAVIFLGYSVTNLLDEMSKRKGRDGDLVTEIATRFGEVMQSFPRGGHDPKHGDDNIRSALGIIEAVARAVTKSEKGGISVCLATYEGTHSERMRIRHRNPGSTRPVNKCFDGTSTIAHRACKSGPDPRVVNDLRAFGSKGRRSPTQSDVTYRSLFIIPVERVTGAQKRVCGFISIDSTRPFAFYGNKQNAIIVVCEPVISHIQDLLQGGEQ